MAKSSHRSSADACTTPVSDPFEILADQHAAGDAAALFNAIKICILSGIRRPPAGSAPENVRWVYEEFNAALKRYSSGAAKDFGEAFGIVRPKGWRQSQHVARHQRDTLRGLYELMRKRPKTRDGFEQAGELLGMSGATAERLFYSLNRPQIKAKIRG